MGIFNIHQAKTQLSALIKMVLEGKQVIIAKNNEPVVELKAIEIKKKFRGGFGKGKGKVIYNDDWNKMDQEIIELFENSTIEPNTD